MDSHPLSFVIIVIGCLTILVLLLVCFYFIYDKNNRTNRNELIFELSIANIISAISYMFFFNNIQELNEKDSIRCKVSGFLILTSELSSCIWGAYIGYYTMRTVTTIETGKGRFSHTIRIVHIIIGYLFPIILGLFGIGYKAYGGVGEWCWLSPYYKDEDSQEIKQKAMQIPIIFLSIAYSIEFVTIGINLVLSIRLILYFYKDLKLKNEEFSELKGIVWNTIKYPIIQFCCLIPASIILIIFIVKTKPKPNSKEKYYITNISRLLMCLQTTIVSFCYAINIDVFKIFKCKKSAQPLNSSDISSAGEIFGKDNSLLIDEKKNKEEYNLKDIADYYSS